ARADARALRLADRTSRRSRGHPARRRAQGKGNRRAVHGTLAQGRGSALMIHGVARDRRRFERRHGPSRRRPSMIRVRLAGAVLACSAAFAAPAALAQSGTVKIAWMDPLSGMMAPLGQNMVRSWQYVADLANQQKWAGDVRFEVVPFDNKLSPQESLTALKSIVDQGIRYVVQGNGSSVAIALSDAIAKHNTRNPGQEIVFLNYAAIDP